MEVIGFTLSHCYKVFGSREIKDRLRDWNDYFKLITRSLGHLGKERIASMEAKISASVSYMNQSGSM